MQTQRLQIGKLLLQYDLVNEDMIAFALYEQSATGERLGECLIRLGFITDNDLARVLADQSGSPFMDLRTFAPDREIMEKIPAQMARQQLILPLYIEEGRLHIAVSDPYDKTASELIFRITGRTPVIHIAGMNELKKLIERFYFLLEHPVEEEISSVTERLKLDPGAEVNVAGLVDKLLNSAISLRVTDVHITPSDLSSRIMFRIDGVMRPAHIFTSGLHNRLVTNIKVRSGMDISEQRKPQDGRMSFEFLGDAFDIRVSSVRTNFGENLVLRLLPSRGGSSFSIRDLGFEGQDLEKLVRLFSLPHGMVLVTGPTGSGKTTTLYAALREQDAIGRNILTVEDPIEYEFLMTRQTQVNERAGYTFASAIRTFLRQDPDVILVGEIRDRETAVLGVRAALTGHLVLSTLHTNTALGALARLRDLGISSYMLSTSLVGVIAQRLVRLLCPHCKRPWSPPPDLLEECGLQAGAEYYQPSGCGKCRETGYHGRVAVSEILTFSRELVKLVAEDASFREIEDQARKEGFTDMWASGRKKVFSGKTSIMELKRVMG